ncbi:PucR C-terminal helix-turn-helix domain-containing protein [Jatrophihabitans endophyticus]|uniref:PucR C-terminal helix-turn-helix domain-containing protein n=1 Tax=Jatrophihabitans endophyticus TaxID=1206085 RepID=A0A1M5P7F6_9ACTN|nr:helix-turn-helix domain-containing protein [Jatrophihabitans endophyticus]SHG97635.1 PucR C-terminal helix-turn-helix domain-containing protein [Jatrophihabitans endophyticus]
MSRLARIAAEADLVVLAPSSLPPPSAVHLLDAEGRPARAERIPPAALVVLDRTAAARDTAQPLDLVVGRVAHRLRPAVIVVASVEPPPRTLPAGVASVVCEAGCGLLWTGPGATTDVAALATRMRTTLAAETERRPADPELVAAALDGDLDLAPLLERLAVRLDACVAVTDRGTTVLEAGADRGGPHEVRYELDHATARGTELAVDRREPIDDCVRDALVPVARIVSLSWRVHRADREAAEPARAQLALILGDDLQAREAALRRSRRLQLFPRRRMVVAVIEPFAQSVGPTGLRRLAAQLEPAATRADPRSTMLVWDGGVVLLLDAVTDLDALVRGFRRAASLPLSTGVSRVVSDARSLPGAHREAARAATIGRRLGAANDVTRYEQLGMLRLLYQLPEHERRAFVAETLGPVAGDDAEAAESRRLLRALRAAQGNLADAARRLFVHRNTLRQRLTKLESAIGPFLDQPDRQLAVYAALELHRLDDDRSDGG